MKSDIQIARETPLKKVKEIAERIGIERMQYTTMVLYGQVPLRLKKEEKIDRSNLVLVTPLHPPRQV